MTEEQVQQALALIAQAEHWLHVAKRDFSEALASQRYVASRHAFSGEQYLNRARKVLDGGSD